VRRKSDAAQDDAADLLDADAGRFLSAEGRAIQAPLDQHQVRVNRHVRRERAPASAARAAREVAAPALGFVAEQGLSERQRGALLADSSRAFETVGVMDVARFERAAKGLQGGVLTQDLGEGHRRGRS
jgi:hypothetical protein